MKLHRIAFSLLIAIAMMQSVSAASPPIERITITSGGLNRDYLLYVPDVIQQPATLVVMVHGGGGSAQMASQEFGWNQLADQYGFVVLYADALNATWNAGDCCGRAVQMNIDDVGYLSDAIADARSRISPEITKVAMVGMSNGGMLTYRYACEVGGLDVIGVVSATLVTDCDDPPPVSVMHVHGLADTNVPFDGSPGDGVGKVDGWPIEDVNALWRTTDECQPPTETTADGIHTSIAECAQGREVVLVTLDGVDHSWPHSQRAGSEGYRTTEELWAFIQNQGQ